MVLGSSVQEICGAMEESPAEGHEGLVNKLENRSQG